MLTGKNDDNILGNGCLTCLPSLQAFLLRLAQCEPLETYRPVAETREALPNPIGSSCMVM